MTAKASTITDAKLPQLQLVLNEQAMKEHFQDSCEGGKIQSCRIIGKRYKPGKRCIITYELQQENTATPRIIFARIERPRYFEMKKKSLTERGAKLLPQVGLYFWEYQHDPKMKSLADLMNPNKVSGLLADAGIALRSQSRSAKMIQAKVLNYVPRRHCAVMVESGTQRFFGKVYGNDRGLSVFPVMKQLHQIGGTAPGFGTARPLAYDARRRTLWQAWVDGAGFVEVAHLHGLVYASRKTARGLAEFHQKSLSDLSEYTSEDITVKLLERAGLLQNTCPEFKEDISSIVEKILEPGKAASVQLQTSIHGDFNYSQVLFENGRPTFVDFDSVSLGDPLYDVAHFVAGLHRLKVQGVFGAVEVGKSIGEFIECYAQTVPWQVDKPALGKHIATALLCRRAYKVLRQLEPDADEKIRYYIRLAQSYLEND